MEIDTAQHWLERSFEELKAESNGSAQALAGFRSASFDRFSVLGFPSSHDEEWKYTSIKDLSQSEFRLAQPGVAASSQIDRFIIKHAEPHLAVFVNGRFDAGLSDLNGLPAGASVETIAAAARRPAQDRTLLKNVGAYVNPESSLAALNGALIRDGALVRIGRGVQLERPVQLLFLNTDGCERAVVPARVFIVSEEHSAASIIETYAGLSSDPYFTSAVTEAVVREGAWLEHTKVGLEGPKAYHIGICRFETAKASRLVSNVFTFGGRLVRNEFAPVLNGEGIEALLNGLTVIGGKQHVDNNLSIDHAKPNCFSRELFKGIYSGESTGVFSGTIEVRPDAQKTNAVQSNQSLLLSDDASVNARPQLKIFADDVKCTHGATVGQLDDEALFYMRSRGVAKEEARNLLIHAFAGDIITHVSIDALREKLEELLLHALEQRVVQV